jgi:3-hydroxyacyl-CoA dehydrogenase / enoyl-CoA hydratase / 3-hydroxybutyryl-CoA epimerase
MTPERNITLSVNEQGHCFVEIDVSGKAVNLISSRLLTELSQTIDSIRSDARIKGVIFLSGKLDHFIGGAEIDVHEFLSDLDATLGFVKQGRAIYQRIAELPVPTLAAIHGACLGGGLELALACRYRLASEHQKTRIGLPEVMLGILPAWGGTTRLPRLIGLSAALDMLLSGKQLDARRAERIGLVDRVTTSMEIATQAEKFLSDILSGGDALRQKTLALRMRSQKNMVARFLNQTLPGRAIVFHQARKNVLRITRGHYPAPLVIIDVIRKGIGAPIERSFELEQEGIESLVKDESTKNLLHVFSLKMHSGKPPKNVNVPGTVPAATPIPPFETADRVTRIRKVGVLGAGVMGAGIAQWLLHHEIPVRLRDINEEAVSKGIKYINEAFQKIVSKRKLRPEEKSDRMRLLSTTTGYSGFATCDLIIEAVAERMEIKHRVIRDLQEVAGWHGIFATNTSSLSVTSMAEPSKYPERILGLHFFNPVAQMPLVEVVRGRQTSAATLSAGVAFVKQIGKTPLVVSDSPGFLVNRILMAYGNEAGLLLEEGASVESIDDAMKEFGLPMGPFTMMDVVGLDIAHHTAESIRRALGLDPAEQSRIGDQLFAAGMFGKKTGRGFYRYEDRKKHRNPELDKTLEAVRKERGLSPRPTITEKEITDRLIMIMANTAAWCLETKVVEEPGDVDLGLIMGAGFPPFRGGLLKYCDYLGITAVKEMLDRYARTAGPRFSSGPLITKLARKEEGFYQSDK